mgnify:CR=1 FL=1
MIMERDVLITEEGPDKGKTFVVRQMPLIQGDRWANRVALALLKSGVDVSPLTKKAASGKSEFVGLLDMANVINVALKALGGVDDDVAQGLLDELMRHVSYKLPNGTTRTLMVETDIGSISTLWKLRIEAIKVNLDFLKAGVTQ